MGQSKSERKTEWSLGRAERSFLAYLKAVGKSEHTLKSYTCDLRALQNYLKTGHGHTALQSLTRDTLLEYSDNLRAQGLKVNSRRRHLMTASQFLAYLAKKKKLRPEAAPKLPAPHKVERIPEVLPFGVLQEWAEQLPESTPAERRNKFLVETLLETGAQVSEVAHLKWADFEKPLTPEARAFLRIGKKKVSQEASPRTSPKTSEDEKRTIELSPAYAIRVTLAKATSIHLVNVFPGYTKTKLLPHPISSRGVELILKDLSTRFPLEKDVTARLIRHSVVTYWLQTGKPWAYVRERLGFKSDYAEKSYKTGP